MDIVLVGFILEAALFIGGLFKVYTDMQVHFKEIDVRLHAVEKQDDEIYAKLDEIMRAINEIRLDMKDKIDR